MSNSECAPLKAGDKAAQPESGMPTVFFDGGCSLCSREVAHYLRLRGADSVRWVDIGEDHKALATHGLSRDAAMPRFYVRDAAGHWHTGAWGFAELWSQLPAYRWLAQTVRTLRMLSLLDRAYGTFARWRLRRRFASVGVDREGRKACVETDCTRSADSNG